MKFILKWVINAAALYAAILLVDGINLVTTFEQTWVAVFLLALVFGLLNALLRPLLMALTCPLIILTLGLGTLLINTLLFYLTGLIGQQFGFGFTVDGFWSAFLGALIVTIISVVLSLVIRDEPRRRPRKRSRD
jgi:putative membrane protein